MNPSLYQRALGDDFSRLSPTLQALHSQTDTVWQGVADVQWGTPAWLRGLLHIAVLLRRLPAEGSALPCQITLQRSGDGESWQRRFGRTPMVSKQFYRRAALWEAMGPLRLQLNNRVENGELAQHSAAVSLFGIALPLHVTATESSTQDQMQFDVNIGFKNGQGILRYRGQLSPTELEKQA